MESLALHTLPLATSLLNLQALLCVCVSQQAMHAAAVLVRVARGCVHAGIRWSQLMMIGSS